MTTALQLDNTVDPFTSPDVCFYVVEPATKHEHTTPVEALADHVEAFSEQEHGPGLAASGHPSSLRDAVDRLAPVTVLALIKSEVDEQWFDETTRDLARLVEQRFSSDYGSSPGGHRTDRTWERRQQEAEPALVVALSAAVREHVEKVGVYSCKDVAERTYSADEMWSMLCVYYGFERGV
jgi:hypothetical protein